MCGIIAYSGKNGTDKSAKELVAGLKAMEYRGYDSWGVAIATEKGIFLERKTGSISSLNKKPKQPLSFGIGHTRWATHGGVTENNAHPHVSSDGRFVVVQNGIVENFLELKKDLQKKGYKFVTQTDTEVIVHLVHWELEKLKKEHGLNKKLKLTEEKNFREAVRKAFLQLSGRNTFVVLDRETETIVAIRQGSPLVIGKSDKEVFLASDTLPLLGKVPEIVYVDDDQVVEIKGLNLQIFSAKNGKKIKVKTQKLSQEVSKIDKDGFDHFMIKEIYEQQHTVTEAVSYSEEEFLPLIKKLKKAEKIYTIGAGTAAFAAGQIARFLREAGYSAYELIAYDSESYLPIITKKDVVIAVSQSGETADTLEVVKTLKKKKVPLASIVNMMNSTLTRMSDYQFFSRSGPEICVASTKAYTAQVTWGYVLVQTMMGNYRKAQREVHELSTQLQEYFQQQENQKIIKKLAKNLVKEEHVFVLGKSQHMYTSLEGALKIKEITYKHFEGFSSGELKHGVIALVEKGTYVFGIIGGNTKEKQETLNALAEVKARGAKVVGIASEPHEFFDVHLFAPDSKGLDPVTKIVPFQLLSYYLALELHNDPDKPRNLAKSVTVK